MKKHKVPSGWQESQRMIGELRDDQEMMEARTKPCRFF